MLSIFIFLYKIKAFNFFWFGDSELMASLSLIGPIKSNAITSFQPSLFPVNYSYCSCRHNSISLVRNIPRNVHVHGNAVSPTFSYQSFLHRNLLYSEREKGGRTSYIAFDANKNSSESAGAEEEEEEEEEEEDNNEALEADMKLNSAFKNKNTQELSAGECQWGSNFLSFFPAFQGKMQVLELFNNLIKMLGENIYIVVNPTLHEGMDVGLGWKFVHDKTHTPLGKGFSFQIYQKWNGKAVIKNIEMFMVPPPYLVPFRLKMTANLAQLVEKIGSIRLKKSGKKGKWILCIVLALLFLAAFLLFFRKLSS